MRLHRVFVMLVLGTVSCQSPSIDDEQEARSQSCVLDANKWRSQLIWPVNSMALGTTTYSELQLRSILAASIQGNGLIDLAQQLIAAKLNYAMGASAPDFVSTIAAADALIGPRVVPPIGTGFLSSSLANSLATKLAQYNKGAKNAGPCVGAQSDVAIAAMSVDNGTPNVGDTVTFTITLANYGPVDATGVTATDLLPAGLTLVAFTTSQGTYAADTGLWTVGAVTAAASKTLTIKATVATASAKTNTASITHADQFDPNLANNSASISVTPQAADLEVTKTVSDSTPNVGDTITFTIRVTNHGPQTATNVSVVDLLPAGLTFAAVAPSQGVYSSSAGVWAVGTVTTTTAQTLTIVAVVSGPAAATNVATISHSDQFDPTTTNNTASATETPQLADLQMQKTIDNLTPEIGSTVTYTVTVKNLGPDTATNVSVQDLLPAGVTFVSATAAQGTYVDSTGNWTVGTLASGVARSLTIVATFDSSLFRTNTATVSTSDQFDPVTINNAASVTATPP